jgi:hypothetical protein
VTRIAATPRLLSALRAGEGDTRPILDATADTEPCHVCGVLGPIGEPCDCVVRAAMRREDARRRAAARDRRMVSELAGEPRWPLMLAPLAGAATWGWWLL